MKKLIIAALFILSLTKATTADPNDRQDMDAAQPAIEVEYSQPVEHKQIEKYGLDEIYKHPIRYKRLIENRMTPEEYAKYKRTNNIAAWIYRITVGGDVYFTLKDVTTNVGSEGDPIYSWMLKIPKIGHPLFVLARFGLAELTLAHIRKYVAIQKQAGYIYGAVIFQGLIDVSNADGGISLIKTKNPNTHQESH